MSKSFNIVALIVIAIIAIIGVFTPGGKTVVEKVTEKVVGAIAGPDIESQYLSVNGVEQHFRSGYFNTASTTRCALQAPTHASSTLSFDGVIKAATTTDYILTIAKSANAFATTTLIRETAFTGAGIETVPTASTTYQLLSETNRTFKPGEWLVVSTAGPSATAFDVGSCSAIFTVGAK